MGEFTDNNIIHLGEASMNYRAIVLCANVSSCVNTGRKVEFPVCPKAGNLVSPIDFR